MLTFLGSVVLLCFVFDVWKHPYEGVFWKFMESMS